MLFDSPLGQFSTEHAQSSYGQLVLVRNGQVYGSADIVTDIPAPMPASRLTLASINGNPAKWRHLSMDERTALKAFCGR